MRMSFDVRWWVRRYVLLLIFLALLARITVARLSRVFPCPEVCLCDIVTQRVDCAGAGLAILPPILPPSTRILLFQENRLDDRLTVSIFNISALTRLRQLSLANNSLLEIGNAVFARQDRLIKLDLTANHLQSVPTKVREMRLLKHLYLGDNHISYINNTDLPPNSVLQQLFLDNNEINVLQRGAFASQKELQALYLGGNIISNISVGLFSRLPALLQLDLSFNRLGADLNLQNELLGDDIPTPRTVEVNAGLETGIRPPLNFSEWFAPHGAPSLQTLYLEGNIIKTIAHDAFVHFPALSFLNLAHNELTFLPPHVFDNTTMLRQLDLSWNNLTTLPAELFGKTTYFEELDLSRNMIYELPETIFYGAEKSLVKLDLGGNYLESMTFLGKNLRHLAELDLSANSLVETGSVGFTTLFSIEVLWLQDNMLSDFPNVRNLTRLREIYLSNNFISHIPHDAFDGDVSVELISIEYNQIVTIQPEPFTGLMFLHTLEAAGNPINCDCTVKWMDAFTYEMSYESESVNLDAAYEMGVGGSTFNAMEVWVAPLKVAVSCNKPNIVTDHTIDDALYGYPADLICTHDGNPRSIIILIVTWLLIIIVFLVLFWGRTFWLARKQLGSSLRHRKTFDSPKEGDTCYVISSVSKKAGNGQYHLLPDKNENEPLVFVPNHEDDSCKIRTFDRSTEIFIETTV